MKKWLIACIVLIFMFLGVMAILVVYNTNVVEVRTLKVFFEIGDKVGVNVGTDALYFGKSPPGSTPRRDVVIENAYPYPVQISIKLSEEINPYITVSDNNFILSPNTTKTLTFYATSKKDAPYANFTGEVKVFFRK